MTTIREYDPHAVDIPMAVPPKGNQLIPTTYHYLRAWAATRLPEGERGAGLVEYILLVSMVILVCIGAVALFRSRVLSGYQDNAETITNAS